MSGRELSRPDHVPEAAVYDFDMFGDPQLQADPHARLLQLHHEAPKLFWTPRNGGHWVALGHEEALNAARDPGTFSSVMITPELVAQFSAMLPADMPRIPQPVPINLDPPMHGKLRAPLQASFSPRSALALKEKVRRLAVELIDGVVKQRQCDFISAIAEPLPVRVFLEVLGLPPERIPEFRALVQAFFSPAMGNPIETIAKMRTVVDAMAETIKARKNDPRDDLISLLWSSETDDGPVTYEMMEDYCLLLFLAGLDTVINAMGYGIRHLARDTHLQELLRGDRTLIPDATEELLRRYSFVVTARRVTRKTQFAGRTLAEGDKIQIFLPAANLDPDQFPSPEAVDLRREDKVHIAFGAGPHRCLGSHLARIELQVLYAEWLARVPPFRLDETQPVTFRTSNIIAIERLPIRWD